MGLESRYRESFSKSIREKGEQLVMSNRVSVYEGGSDRFCCEVQDDDLYDAQLHCKDKQVTMICDCTNVKNKPCSHLWAALLIAERSNQFKDGAKRGVRLALTAAALRNENVKPIEQPAVKPIYVNSSSSSSVQREILFVISGETSNFFKSLGMDFYWRPVGEKGPLKPLDPFSHLSGFSQEDILAVQSLSRLNLAQSGSFRLKQDLSLQKMLESLVTSNRLFTQFNRSVRQFKKVASITEGQVQFSAFLDEGGFYHMNFDFSGYSLDHLVYIDKNLFVTEKEIFIIKELNLENIINYCLQHNNTLQTWDVEEFLEKSLIPSGLDGQSLPGRMACEKIQGEPRGHLFVRTALFKFRDKEQLHADLSFQYGAKRIAESEAQQEVLDFYNSAILERNEVMENQCRETLKELGFRFNESSHKEEFGWKLSPSKLPNIVETLLRKEWIVIAEGKTYVSPKSFELKISSGTDWFDLKGHVEFENEVVPVAGLVKAAEGGSHYVELGDGSFGILPEEWLKYYTVLTQLGEVVGDDLRFRKSQALIIEKLLSEKLETDEGFKSLARSLENVQNISPAKCHPAFKGSLREYQKTGLSWLQFLEKTGFGGILADDMGLGKTVQILALLQYSQTMASTPAMLVVPRSLVFNWESEIHKFTPGLKYLIYTGPSRKKKLSALNEVDIVITTYGTMRQDVETLVNYNFNYCILDEAQAIKNRDSSTAKAIRLINAKHRISMSGTPVENSISDLISQFEFLNPGMTAGGKLASLIQGDEKLNKENLKRLREAFKPFILRRTKQQVAKDLPEKVEQVIYCDMEESQKDIYNQTLDWYKQELSKEEKPEAGKSQGINFLGALTRLRQLSCHPALVNEEWLDKGSVKITLLVERLKVLISEGHRVLIFSQFTSFLKLIENQVQKESWQYCYLDGGTSDRQGEVEKFQNNKDIPLFLISLKAGGVGLNLTGADYVFLMDPWWNPAIENQAVDRAYRIGQKRNVIACRLVCRGTVEEKVLQMQRNKQFLADSLIDEDAEFIQKLSMDEIRELIL